ncbi:bifunctional YncE family protein/alkaline phosphatase family protein [Acidithiobacillus sp.]|uniref:bifunctional YncE family protein/alkaline phosphatase family protein n=1 Tax=Acidithiobacillus sp. TaxID=1872118 RepID=UPI0025BC9629|nr:bifunctional YncE family protein/alkaline phosphatase family protein [Acidithiobacillus sp.]
MKLCTAETPGFERSSANRRPAILALLLCVGAVSVPLEASAGTSAAPALVAQPVRISAANRDEYTGILPTWRRVTPVGSVVSTPNFPTQVAAAGGQVAVLANGATPFQTITWFDPELQREKRFAALGKAVPPKPVAFATPGGTAIAIDPAHTGAAGTAYATAQTASVLEGEAEASLKVESNPTTLSTTTLGKADLFQGLVAGPNGVWYATGGVADVVYALQERDGKVSVLRSYPLHWQSFPKDQYPYVYQGNHRQKPWLFYPDSVVLGPQQQHLYVTGMLANSLARIDLASGKTDYVNVGPYPFAVVLADGGQRLVVSDWAGDGVTVVDRQSFRVLGRVRTAPPLGPHSQAAGAHPTALVAASAGPDVWVADANSDAIVEIDSQTLKPVRVIADSPYPDAPPGSYPDALALADGKLFVANAGNDDVAVFDAQSGKAEGLIPTAWYPTALAVQGGALYITAGKGFGTGPNLQWQYIGNMMHGLLQKVDLRELPQKLPHWTTMALEDNGFDAKTRRELAVQNEKTAAFLRQHIQYVVFILRENKTFDEDFGDYQAAGSWADPKFDLYGPKELPNLYRMAAHNVLFANFMADGEVTAQGHQWTDGASDSDVVQRLWPEYYSSRGLLWNAGPGGTSSLSPGAPGSHNPYQYNRRQLGHDTNPWMSYPERLYLFNDLLTHRVSFEDFGENLSRRRDGVLRQALLAHVDASYPGWDRMLLDGTRVKAAIRWLRAHPGSKFPHFLFLWIPDDHTAGLAPCYYSPDTYVADNDHATAELLHYLASTPQWQHMAVFLTEDDAQSGADHINAHRTFALAMGPWVKSGYLDTTPLSQVNIVRTIEGVFDLPPMSQWDANAQVISGIWRQRPRHDPMPVLSVQVPVRINPGKCSRQLLLRREAGATGHIPTAAWLKTHTNPHGAKVALDAADLYTPTSLLKVSGPEQLRQEWIASKGRQSYQNFEAYLRRYAAAHGTTVASFEANEGKLH